MPALLVPVIMALGASLAVATVIANVIVLVSTLVYGAAQQRRMEKRARAQANANLQDRTVSVMAADAPWQVIYGEATVGGLISDMLTSGAKDQFKHVIYIWAAHECQAIEDILVKGESIGALDGAGNVTGGRWYKGETRSTSQLVTFNGSGQATLTHAPLAVMSVSQQTTTVDEGWVQVVDDLDDITGLVIAGNTITKAALAGLERTVNYTYAAPGAALLRVHHHLGSPTQAADATLLAELPAVWSSDDRLRGLCYSVIRFDLNEPEFQGGPVQVTARIKGRKCWDPRTSTTAWTDNPALCTADFLTAEWGKRVLSAQMVWASVSAAANACDEVLADPAGEKLYTCNGSFKTDQDTDTTLTQLCQAMAGFAVSSGAWSLQAGVYTAPVMALSDADSAGSVEVLGAPPGSELFNGLRGKYYDPARFDQLTDYTPYANAAFVAEDNGAAWGDLHLPFTNADWRCANLTRVQVERSRGMQLVLPAKNRARALRAGQRVTLSNSVLAMTDAVFRVVKKEQRIGQPVMLTLAQDDAGMYDQADAPASLGSPSVPTSDPFVVAPVDGLAVVSDISVATWNLDGTVLSNTWVSWTASTDELVVARGAMQVEYRAAEATAWTRAPEAPGDSVGMHLPLLPERQLFLVAARWRNSLGVTGDWRHAWVLTERLPAARAQASLIDPRWWKPGAAWQWELNETDPGENSIVYGIGPRGLQQPLWHCVAAGTAGASADGGWGPGTLDTTPKNAFAVDTAQTYRFAVPVRRLSGTGAAYLGPSYSVVCDLNTTTPNANPYFCVSPGGLPLNRWYLMVGYVFPAGSTGLTNAGAGIYDMETGALVAAGTNFCWAAATTECSTRAYQYYASTGAQQRFGYPTVERLDGYQVPDYTYLGAQQVTAGDIVDSSTTSGSTGSPGASVTVVPAYGPTIVTTATDELDIVVNGYVELTFWSQAVVGRVEVFLKYRPTAGGAYTEIGLRRRFLTPCDVYTNALRVSLDKVDTAVKPGAGSFDYELECRITWIDAAGSVKQCQKDFDVDFCQWRVTKRRH